MIEFLLDKKVSYLIILQASDLIFQQFSPYSLQHTSATGYYIDDKNLYTALLILTLSREQLLKFEVMNVNRYVHTSEMSIRSKRPVIHMLSS